MAITAKLYETALGGDENPWATDTDSNSITIDQTGGTGVIQVVDTEDDISATNATNATRAKAWQTTAAAAADEVIRATLKLSHTSSSDNCSAALMLRTTTGNAGLEFLFGPIVAAPVVDVRNYGGAFIGSTAITMAADTWYEAVCKAASTTINVLFYDLTAFPPGSDYKTVTWTYTNTSASYTTASGQPGIMFRRSMATQPTARFKNIIAIAATTGLAVPTVGVTAGNSLVTVDVTDAAAKDKRATLWTFIRYKATSQPTDENDGTLVTGAGTGMGGGAIRSDGRFIDDPGNFNITGLSNGTAYYVRPFAVAMDGTIVAGTAVSATPSGGDVTAPVTPTDFAAAYASPFIASRVDLTWTNPSEAGDYRITYRTDGTDPTSSTDGTVLQDWTAYTSSSAGSKSATGLTNGLRYRFALWHRDAVPNISTGAFIQKVAVKQITLFTPADAATGVGSNPYLIWHTSSGEAENSLPIHYKVEISTSEADEGSFLANLVETRSSLDDGVSGFEYNSTGSTWVALPSSGLAAVDVGKDVRYHFFISTNLHYYWRVSAQQAGS